MRFQIAFVAIAYALLPTVLAAPAVSERACENSATARSCWGDYDTSTNYYDECPVTGVTVEYWFNVVNLTVSPDGVERIGLAVNGTIPGPTIIANWGDTVIVHLTNSLTTNGTGIHFHGIRQNYTSEMDGVPSVTQCPIAPGSSFTYKWRACQYGTSWWHSHFSLQAWDGVFGGILINGPATANYDIDVGTITLSDWTHQSVNALYLADETRGPQQQTNGLINGTNVYGTLGSRFEQVVTSGKSYRFRLINTAIDTHWKFMIDNHTMSVIATDLVPIKPYTADYVSIGMGQRYDIVVTMNQTEADYWIRAIPQSACSDNAEADNIKGILRYDSSSTSDPTTTGYTYTDECTDEDMANLVPYLALDASDEDVEDTFAVTNAKPKNNMFKWYMGGTTLISQWDDPTLLQVIQGVTTFNTSAHVIQLPNAGEWVYFVIATTMAVPHPMHLHGHDFYILAQGTGVFSTSTTLTLTNPPRRDVAMLPLSGYLVIGFPIDNPGCWLMHCHIGWHTSEGLALQLLEMVADIPATVTESDLTDVCTAWEEWTSSTSTDAEMDYQESGI